MKSSKKILFFSWFSKIKDISQLSDNVGAAVRMLGELQKKWKEVGAVSSHKYKDILLNKGPDGIPQ